MRIVIIGTGNTATVLGRLFKQAGHSIVQVYGRNKQRATALAEILDARPTNHESQVSKECDLYVVAVSDGAIGSVASWLHVEKKMVVHTAGSVDANILSVCSKNYGVLYPLQSLRKETAHIPRIPFVVEANTSDANALIYDFARSISKDVQTATGRQRLMIHVAAIMVSNFTNHLYSLAEDYCNKEEVDFSMLLPLITETAERLNQFSPFEIQTGPAVRGDWGTVQKHIHLLENHPVHQAVYRVLSESIEQWKNRPRKD